MSAGHNRGLPNETAACKDCTQGFSRELTQKILSFQQFNGNLLHSR